MLTSQAIEVIVNGESFRVPAGSNIKGLLTFLKIAPDKVAVELNKALVRKRHWDSTQVDVGAHVEIVEFVGGG